jgi:hypothetical protein
MDWMKFIRFHVDGFNGLTNSLLPSSAFPFLHKAFPGDFTPGMKKREEKEKK